MSSSVLFEMQRDERIVFRRIYIGATVLGVVLLLAIALPLVILL